MKTNRSRSCLARWSMRNYDTSSEAVQRLHFRRLRQVLLDETVFCVTIVRKLAWTASWKHLLFLSTDHGSLFFVCLTTSSTGDLPRPRWCQCARTLYS
jgi:hypothetical protein